MHSGHKHKNIPLIPGRIRMIRSKTSLLERKCYNLNFHDYVGVFINIRHQMKQTQQLKPRIQEGKSYLLRERFWTLCMITLKPGINFCCGFFGKM